jgi:hypothetical protein
VTVVVLTAWALLALLPGKLNAQSAIAGLVRDTTGGVLPGVTVEAASPALIEKVRTVVTDEAGQYLIVDLRPGLYTVTFTLPGFNTVKRDGLELPTSFTATVNAELRVGALEETITVSGESPVVDMRSATAQQVLTRELLNDLPTGRNLWGTGATLTGVTLSAPDVGGTAGMQQTYMSVHGSERRDNAIQVDGMSVNGIEGDGAIQNYFNQGMFEEWSFQTSALGAEVQSSGVRLNMIPKEGGNTIKGSVFWSHTPGNWQTNNFTPELAATGLRAPNRVERIFDLNLGLGGPIQKGRLWFFTSFRRWGVDQTITDSFYNLDPTRRTYVPADGKQGRPLQPTVDDNVIKSGVARLTFQISQKHKFSAYIDRIVKFRGHECPAPAAEEGCGVRNPKRYFTAQAKYTATLTSRLLIEGGWSENDETYSTQEVRPSVGPNDVGRLDRITLERWSAAIGPFYFRVPDRHTFSGSLSYVTGSHAVKTGVQLGKGGNRHQRRFHSNLDLYQEYRNGVPASVLVHNTPQEAAEEIKYDLGIFVQDSWKYKRVTLNPGVRVELFNTYVPAQDSPAGRFVPARHFDKIENLPNWKDTAPRFGAVYDLFGDSKTALKGHIGKYVTAFSTVGFAQVYNPMVFQTDRRTWTDRNGDDIAQDNEIGPVQTPFNISGVSNRNPDPNIKRPYQWEYNLGIQRELRRGVSVSANWVRRDFRRLFWTDNVLVSHDDYTIVQVPNPLNPSERIPIHNLNVAKRAQVQRLDKNSDRNRRWYNGFDLGFTARVGSGNIFGGASTGRMLMVTCEVDDPNELRFCDHRDLDIPYLTQFKLSWSYPLPLDVQFSGNWQGYPGVPLGVTPQERGSSLNVNYLVDRTIIPTLTQSSVTVPLIPPGAKYLKRWNQIDIRFAKRLQVRNMRVQGQFDIFNLMNASSILDVVQTLGSRLDRPTAILQGRLFAVGAQLNF